MTPQEETKQKVVESYINLSRMLDKTLQQISSLKTTNPNFISFQNEYKSQITGLIRNARSQLDDLQRNAIWDKLVVAFVGVTNAGKSTIIETCRILFDEPERKKALSKCPSGVDGEIIGDGRPDYTREYKEYDMTITGKPFVLIDVPGIEGEESVVKSEILKALSKAHCVFFVQGEGKKPDIGIVQKIKSYLKDWVKVYSIYNVRGTAFNYDEMEERCCFLTPTIKKVEHEIEEEMKLALGKNYAENITIQARLALCAHARFARNQKSLQNDQKDLITCFGTQGAIYEFSNFKEINNRLDFLASHFIDEIADAQRKKLFKLHADSYQIINNANSSKQADLDRTISKFRQCKNNILKHIQTSKNSISNQFRREFEEMFSVLEDDGCSYIDAGYTGDKLKVEIERDQKRLMSIVEGNLKDIVHNEMIDLRDKVENEVLSLQEYAKIDKVSDSFSAQFQLSIGNVIRELNLGVGDIVNWAGYLGACFGLGWAIVAGWNPVGWILTVFGFGFGIFGDSKQSKAKSKFRESLSEAKSQFYRDNFPNLCSKVDDALDFKSEEITKKIDSIITDFKKLANQINNIKVSIKRNSIQYK